MENKVILFILSKTDEKKTSDSIVPHLGLTLKLEIQFPAVRVLVAVRETQARYSYPSGSSQ